MSAVPVQLGDIAAALEPYLRGILDTERAVGAPARLVDAMAHGLLGGGKRFRPYLVVTTAGLFGVPMATVLPAAAALECIHAYSLIHDDLPAMDNDELRRGLPTVWKAFDEWTAILAGDALQTLAFQIIAAPACHRDATGRAALIEILALASGARGMVGGQALDLEASHLAPAGARPQPTPAAITRLQAMKTGRLITAACEMGAVLGNAAPAQRSALKRYGDALGVAFQISDDLLDAEGHAATVGKATGKDAAAGKATFVGLLGVDAARRELDRVIEEAICALADFGTAAQPLIDAARYMDARSH